MSTQLLVARRWHCEEHEHFTLSARIREIAPEVGIHGTKLLPPQRTVIPIRLEPPERATVCKDYALTACSFDDGPVLAETLEILLKTIVEHVGFG